MIFWKRKPAYSPVLSAGNPGQGSEVRTGFANAGRSWTEEADLVRCLADVASEHGEKAARKDGWLRLEGGLYLRPQVVSVEPLEDGGVRTATTIGVCHETRIPRGIFEYQHATGNDTRESVMAGFRGWWELDLPALKDALGDRATACTALEFELPGRQDVKRRVLLGPPARYAASAEGIDEEHPFCPCCLFTNSFEAFRGLLESGEFHGVRLFVLRDAKGNVEADCRVDGEDWEPGREALIKYGAQWPPRGYEFRKQFVVIDSVPAVAAAGS